MFAYVINVSVWDEYMKQAKELSLHFSGYWIIKGLMRTIE